MFENSSKIQVQYFTQNISAQNCTRKIQTYPPLFWTWTLMNSFITVNLNVQCLYAISRSIDKIWSFGDDSPSPVSAGDRQ